jgi:aminoacyl tRNA synthase complex-interacting multifunctional protein 1
MVSYLEFLVEILRLEKTATDNEIELIETISKSHSHLVPSNPLSTALVQKWLMLVSSKSESINVAEELNLQLNVSSYVAGNSFSLGDLLAYYQLHTSIKHENNLSTNIQRWLDQLYHEPVFGERICSCSLPQISISQKSPLKLFDESVVIMAANSSSPSSGSVTQATNVAPITESESQVSGEKKKEKKQAPAAASPQEPSPLSECDFRVGKIVNAWVHPDSDKLYCEEIDVGEAEPRKIASGLRAHMTIDQVNGARVVIVANLKERKLAGFPSNGMVLCATDPVSGVVEFITPPANAKIGERVTFIGHENTPPAPPSRMDKKKILDAVLPELKTNEKCEATWNGIIAMTSDGAVTVATVKNAPIK